MSIWLTNISNMNKVKISYIIMKFFFRHFIFFVNLLFILFILPIPIYGSFDKFEKYENNPIITLGLNSSWDSYQVYSPRIISDGNIYKMWFSGSNGTTREIGYADSTDLINFAKSSDNPLLKWNIISPNDVGVEHPFVIKDSSFGEYPYKMWFSNAGNHLYTFELFYKSSRDGINWTDTIKLSLKPETTDWDSQGTYIGAPSVIYNSDSQLYQLWYVARGSYQGSTRWRIGYAESQDGTNWIKNLDPVLVPDQTWEGTDVANPHIIKDENGIYYMFYY
ncbi:MAG: hypothetical protein MUO21_08415, partial [Nitrososphaeraceae archaeon]|nr:hypothetical protein [Nitrososphaeraceae archaeon]